MCDANGNGKDNKGEKDMTQAIKRIEMNKAEMRSIDKILNKGIKRYDKALKKLSKN